jgi:hypothetical protein
LEKRICIFLSVVVLGLVARVYAEPVNLFTEGPGHSWDVTWNDTSDRNPINEIVAIIVSGPATFDDPLTTSISDWTTPGILVNPDETYISGAVNVADKSVTLSFADPEPAGDVVVDIYELYNGHLAAFGSFQWEDLPSQGNWATLPATVPDGGLTVSMLGMGVLGLCCVRRMVK